MSTFSRICSRSMPTGTPRVRATIAHSAECERLNSTPFPELLPAIDGFPFGPSSNTIAFASRPVTPARMTRSAERARLHRRRSVSKRKRAARMASSGDSTTGASRSSETNHTSTMQACAKRYCSRPTKVGLNITWYGKNSDENIDASWVRCYCCVCLGARTDAHATTRKHGRDRYRSTGASR